MALGLIGLALAYGIVIRELEYFDGYPHKLQKTFSYKSNADEYCEYLKRSGKQCELVTKSDKHGHKFYVVYLRIDGARKKSTEEKK